MACDLELRQHVATCDRGNIFRRFCWGRGAGRWTFVLAQADLI